MKLLRRMRKNILIGMNKLPGSLCGPRIALNSLKRLLDI